MGIISYTPEQIAEMISSGSVGNDKYLWPYNFTGALYGYFGTLGQEEGRYVSRSMADPFFVHDFAERGRGPLGLVQGKDVSSSQEGRPAVKKRYFLGVFDGSGVRNASLMELLAAYNQGKSFGEKLRQDSPPDGSVSREELDTRAICLPRMEISDLLFPKEARLL